MPNPIELPALAEMSARLDRALQISPADETELLWLETRHGHASQRGKAGESSCRRESLVCVRVHERGRIGTHRTGSAEASDLEGALRAALAQAKSHARLPGLPHLPADAAPILPFPPIDDPAISALDGAGASQLLRQWIARSESARLWWSQAHVLVWNSRGLRRKTAVSAVGLAAEHGRAPGAGYAAGAARSLASLDGPAILARARSGSSEDLAGEPPAGPVPVWLAPEAAARVVAAIARTAFSAHAYRDGSSFLRDHVGVQVFDRAVRLCDDATDAAGMPFPFDLEGTAKRPVELIAGGIPKTPALDERHAALLGLPATASASGGDDASFANLFLRPGEAGRDDLGSAAAGGLWIGDFHPIEVFHPLRLQARAVARGVRRVEKQGLGVPVPDLVWEGSLLRALSNVLAVGKETVCVTGDSPLLGGVSAPDVVLGEIQGLRIL